MSPLSFLLLALAPGVFWLWQIYRRNQHRPDSKDLVVRTFLLGAAVALPVILLEKIVEGPGREQGTMTPAAAAFTAFVVAGLVEELGKFFVVRASLYRSPYFDEPLRGLVYSAAAALGFASLENGIYMLSHGAEVIAVRAVLSTPGHVTFSALWGYALGVAKQREEAGGDGTATVALGIGAAIASHGGFDYFLFIGEPASALLVFAVGVVAFFVLFRRATRTSRHRDRQAQAMRTCPGCQAVMPSASRFCPACGATQTAASPVYCGGCRQVLPEEARFCAGCGSRVLRAPV